MTQANVTEPLSLIDLTADEADLVILGLSNDKNKFAIALGGIPEELNDAYERGIDNDWWILVDVDRTVHSAGQVVKVFKLTAAGVARLAELRAKFPQGRP